MYKNRFPFQQIQFLLFSLFISPLVFAGGGEDGLSCETAYTLEGDVNEVGYTLREDEQGIYLQFTPTSDSMIVYLSQDENLPFAEIVEVDFYQKESCENLTHVMSKTMNLESFVELYDLNQTTQYLLYLERSPDSTSAEEYFVFSLTDAIQAPCPVFVPQCGELVKNGGFNYITDHSQAGFVNGVSDDAFLYNIVCKWKGYLTPDLYNKHNRSYAYVFHNGPHKEGIGQIIDIEPGDYIFSIDIAAHHLLSHDIPKEFQVVFWDNSTNTSTVVGVIPSTQIQRRTSNTDVNFPNRKLCISVSQAYDEMRLIPLQDPQSTNLADVYFDNVSLKKAPVGDDIVITEACHSEWIEIGADPSCAIQGATYNWSPNAEMINIFDPNPSVMPLETTTYTLTISNIPGSTCNLTSEVTVTIENPYDNVILHNKGINWLKNYAPYTPASGGNPVKFSDLTFYVEGDFIVNQDVEFEDCNFYMDEDAKIIVDESMFNFVSTGNNGANFIKSCDPDKFWDGIYVDGTNNNSGVSIIATNQDKLIFSNAYNGIVATNNPLDFTIEHVDFDRNNRSLYYEGVENEPIIALINDCIFHCSTPLIGSNVEYYPNQAVKIKNAKKQGEDFQIIDDGISHYPNTFEGSGGSLVIENSNVEIKFAVFQNFNNQYTIPDPGLTKSTLAIDIKGQQTLSSLSEVNIAHSYFNDNVFSISSEEYLNLKVIHNYVNQQGNSLASSNFLNVDENHDVEIKNNTVYDVNRAFNIYNAFIVDILGNTIDIETQSGSGYNSRSRNESVAIMVGVNNGSIIDYVNPPSVNIESNTIKHSKIGILSESGFTKVLNNTILDMNDNMTQEPCYFPPCAVVTPPKPFGIRVLNSVVEVEENKVENNASLYTGNQPSSSTNMVGISVENSAAPPDEQITSSANCNKVKNTGVGLRFLGNCGWQFEDYNNTMEDHFYGFALANNANIGDVGAPNKDANNQWTGSFTHTYNYSYSYNPTHYGIFGGPTIGPNDAAAGFSIMNTATASGPNDINCSAPLLTSNEEEQNQPQKEKVKVNRNKSGHTFQSSVWTRRGQISDSAFNLNQQLLYRQLSMDTALYNSNQWKPFVDSMKNTVLGRSMNRNTNARASIQAANNFDLNVQTLEPILHKIELDSILNSADSATLWQLANLCPYYDGIAVYQARSILQQMGFPPIVNDCEVIEMPSSRYIRTKKMEENESVKLYPNPSEGIITIQYEVGEDENTTFELIDLLGKKQFSSRLNVGNSHQFKLTPMQSGLYIYRLNLNNEIVETGKLILQ